VLPLDFFYHFGHSQSEEFKVAKILTKIFCPDWKLFWNQINSVFFDPMLEQNEASLNEATCGINRPLYAEVNVWSHSSITANAEKCFCESIHRIVVGKLRQPNPLVRI